MKSPFAILVTLLLAACATYSGQGLLPGAAGLDDVIRVMGEPAMRWRDPDGSQQFAYPRGPQGFHTFMAHIGSDGKLQRIENVLDPRGFAQIRPGMTETQVLRVLGPPTPGWTVYFKARNERVWEWRHCNEWNNAARFNVVFDGISGTVRASMSQAEACGQAYCPCSR